MLTFWDVSAQIGKESRMGMCSTLLVKTVQMNGGSFIRVDAGQVCGGGSRAGEAELWLTVSSQELAVRWACQRVNEPWAKITMCPEPGWEALRPHPRDLCTQQLQAQCPGECSSRLFRELVESCVSSAAWLCSVVSPEVSGQSSWVSSPPHPLPDLLYCSPVCLSLPSGPCLHQDARRAGT